ncbi:MAG: helix-turn-helix transcriptional regulator [Deltaproteobacteria bacterium]|nr:helix-turn-helix transcriptional regulator [Deltaproteobacteria bacterium]
MYQRFSENLGNYLKRAREARKIPREELSRVTRISLPFLVALEENDFDFFSQHEFIPGFLKVYTRHLGLDYEEVLQRFHVQWERNRLKKTQQLTLFSNSTAIPTGKAFRPKWNFHKLFSRKIVLILIICVSLSLSLYLHLLSSKIKEPQVPPPAKNAQGITPYSPLAVPEESDETTPSPEDSVSLSEDAADQESPATSGAQKEEGLPDKRKVIGNSDSRRYHLPGMKYYDNVEAYHRVEFESEEEAIQAGYQKAKE